MIPPTELPLQPIRDLPLPQAVNLRSEMEECDYGDEDMESEFSFGKFGKSKLVFKKRFCYKP